MPEAPWTLRRATAADAAVLRDLERSSPIVAGSRSIAVDRGPDYFAQRRMMGDALVLVAEVDGQPVGTYGGVLHTALIDGRARCLLYVHHARILPAFQRSGLGRAFARALAQAFAAQAVESQYWWIDRANVASQAFARGAPNRWRMGVRWGEMKTERHAAAPALRTLARRAEPDDAPRLARILNAAHVGEQMFTPYTPEGLSARLTREPRYYSWADVWVSQGAAVGTWPHWVSLTVRDPDGVRLARVAAALDYGCLPGHEAELDALLRATASALHAQGTDRLSIFTSAPARLHDVVQPLCDGVEEMDFWTPGIPEPAASRYGVYVDHVYF